MMMIWSQKLCAWVPWLGSRAVWRKLPHIAAVAGACLGAGPSAALPLAPHDTGLPAHHATASAPIRAVSMPPMPYAPIGFQSLVYPQAPLPPSVPLVIQPPGAPSTPMPIPPPPPVSVPEPGSFVLLLTATAALLAARRLT